MMLLLITIVSFLLLILVVIWQPYLRANTMASAPVVKSTLRDDTNIRLYHEHKAEIERDFAQQSIDEENYHYLLNELDQSLLQEIEQSQQQPAQRNSRLSVLWPSSLTVLVLAFSMFAYQHLGAYQQLQQPHVAQNPHHAGDDGVAASEQQAMQRVTALQQQVQQQPDNSEAWYELGQALVLGGQFDEADKAFDKVLSIEGEHADVYGAKAQALYYANKQTITDKVQQYIDKALALDPLDPSTNILLGMNGFLRQDYQQAVDYWQRVLESGRDNINTAALQDALQEAKNRLALTAGNTDGDAAAISPELLVDVSLSPEFQQQLKDQPDTVVFIYAVPTNGQRMPLAAVKLKLSDLPTKVVLNNARAMNPQFNLSSVDEVHIYAVVSKQGGAGIKSGDMQAVQQHVPVTRKEPITLTINTLVP